MNLFKTQQPQVDMDELEANINHELKRINAPPPEYVPPARRGNNLEPPLIPLEVIAKAVVRLTWEDAVKMGDAIEAKEGRDLTAKIQVWAKEIADGV